VGNFFTVAPGYYKHREFGIRLKNVFEVIDTGDRSESGAKFLAFRVATLVPFETKLIDKTLLSVQEVS
jgi:Xaa-Pro aminopeptidase